MIFQTMLQRHSPEEVIKELLKTYPHQICNVKGYRAVYKHLLEIVPTVSESRLKIIDVSDEQGSIEPDVFMLEFDRDSNEIIDYALSMIPWAKVVGLSIDEHSDRHVPELKAIVYALFKMTYFGFTERKRDRTFNCLENQLFDVPTK